MRRRRAVVLAVALVVAVVASGPGALAAGTSPAWAPQRTPAVFGNAMLQSAVAVSPTDVWAVGQTRADVGGTSEWRAVAEHWDGASWTRLDTPDRETAPAVDFLLGVTAPAGDDVYAVGQSARPAGQGGDATLVERWDGTSWALVASPDPSGSDAFDAVSATGRDDVWAVGDTADPSQGAFVPLVEHLRAGSWQAIPYVSEVRGCPTGAASLSAADALSDTDVLVAGTCAVGGHHHGFVQRWDGNTWTAVVVAATDTEFTALAGGRQGTPVWAVGDTTPDGPVTTLSGIAYQRTPSGWTSEPMPRRPGVVRTIAGLAVGSSGTYAVGRTSTPHTYQGLIYRWSGSAWVSEPVASAETVLLSGAAVAADGSAWAVGFHFTASTDQVSVLRRRG